MIDIANAIRGSQYTRVVAVMGSQMSKTETMLNCMGHALDDDPAPQLYIAPTKSFVDKVMEPRYKNMVEQCDTLRMKRTDGVRENKTMKHIAGVKVRFAWAGSATELAGDPARDVFVDERDRMEDNVKGEGDPVELADARHSTYPDGCTTVFSTPLTGNVETYIDPVSGLDLYDWAEEVESPTWKIWQDGTRAHWCVPCPDCHEYFVPRFKLLWWPDDIDNPHAAAEEVHLTCQRCGILIDPSHKSDMHAAGRYVCPGQNIDKKGNVTGEPPRGSAASFWVSGLMSPWMTWQEMVEQWLKAVRSGDPEKIQTVVNTRFGELYSIAGQAPDLELVRHLRQPYQLGVVPEGVLKITVGVDIGKDRIHYSVRGWGADMQSWHLEQGELIGPTDEETVWTDLAYLRDKHYDGKPIERAFIDSGYRTSFVYSFCRKYRSWAFPTKGRDTIESSPLTRGKLDVAKNTGKRLAGGLGIWHINTDYFKRWLHERFERDPTLPGAWHLAEDTTEEFCKAMVSEARLVKPSGRITWVLINPNNHYFDCEVSNLAAAYSLNMQTITSDGVQARQRKAQVNEQEKQAMETHDALMKKGDPFRSNNNRPSGGGGWFGGR